MYTNGEKQKKRSNKLCSPMVEQKLYNQIYEVCICIKQSDCSFKNTRNTLYIVSNSTNGTLPRQDY